MKRETTAMEVACASDSYEKNNDELFGLRQELTRVD